MLSFLTQKDPSIKNSGLNVLALMLALPVSQVSYAGTHSTFSIAAWHQNYSARVRSEGDYIDFDSAFDIDDSFDISVKYTLIHQKPLWPNVSMAHTQSTTQGLGVVSATLFGWQVLEGDVLGKLDLSHSDVTAFYRFESGAWIWDAGLKVRRFNAGVTLAVPHEQGQGASASLDINDMIPIIDGQMIYNAPFALPTQLSLAASYIQAFGDSSADLKLATKIGLTNTIQAEVSYRYFDVNYTAGNAVMYATTQGVQLALEYSW